MPRKKPTGSRRSYKPAKGATRGASHSQGTSGELRIIGGDWRSRKLRFPDAGGVRPTPARTRETLFNWLSFQLAGSDCLDLFSGSGALGLEALSRGAAHATLVDNSAELTTALRGNLRLLGAESGTVVCTDADAYLSQPAPQPFDLVFMDPPFRQGWLARLFPLLDTQGWIKPGGWIYVEHESEVAAPATPANWQLHRQKTSGQVTYCLYRVVHMGADENASEAI
ncbi:MAG: 16S rRNA (guanine(966)-N(2))-methyltransferase RsmD [Marinobacter sp.]|uniref:16S rRNA (guanine(966)-N(2))-methyltransferase RsmD n=1 Tax=Marinobacter sp. TaxID=50741 RepID=UPI003F98C3F8